MTTARLIAAEYRRTDGTLSHTAVSFCDPGTNDDRGPLLCQVQQSEDLRAKVLNALDESYISEFEIVRTERHML
jgi:hypothetical protein